MKKITKYIGFVFLIACLISCSNKKRVYETIETQFKESLIKVTKSSIASPVYMVIPRAGCSGCISNAEAFVIECLKDPKKYDYVKFILTDFDSEKLLKARYGQWYKSNLLIIDRENIFNANKSLKTIYPTVYFFKDNSELVKVVQMSPTEDGLTDLIAYKTNRRP